MEKKLYGTVLIKASKILESLNNHPNSTLQLIVNDTGLTAPTALKILETLTYIGYVDRREDKTYHLGSRLVKFSNSAVEDSSFATVAKPYLEELRNDIDETVHLGVLSGKEILYLNKLEPKNQRITMSSRIGITRPLYSSAMGKAVMADFSDEQLSDYFSTTTLAPLTEETITNPLKLIKELEKVRKKQYAIDDEENEKDIYCMGTTIKKHCDIYGAFSVSVPKYRATDEFIQKLAQKILKTKKKIEDIL